MTSSVCRVSPGADEACQAKTNEAKSIELGEELVERLVRSGSHE